MFLIKNPIKFFVDKFNELLLKTLILVKRITKNRYWSTYFADKIIFTINKLVKNEFIPNPKEHLYVEVTNICNLRCRFCAYSKSTNEKIVMPNQKFFDIINQATEFGYHTFGLTPIVGEVFVDKNFMEKIRFLEQHPKVKNYSFFTNFTLANEEIIDQILKTKKLHEFFISIYGHNEKAFINFTQSNSKT
ncbi:MAG: radical SAM protein, partial [Candidatus Lokiarchaeota archaeon]|nr:radical SAM protein [Candidatus Lokiarchaeota archaeon]